MTTTPHEHLHPKPLQKSLENDTAALERMVGLIFDTTEERDRLAFYIATLAPWGAYPSEHQQNTRIAQLTKTTPQTVWNWRAGVTKCTALGLLYALARSHFASEAAMATAFGQAIGRDLLQEVGLDTGDHT